MDEAILKAEWERHADHIKIDLNTANKLIEPYTSESIKDIKLMSDGCANSNYKISFTADIEPVVLRIYGRDECSLQKEKGISELVKDVLPVPEYLYSDTKCTLIQYPYAINNYLDGSLMREVLFSKDEIAISECAYDSGIQLDLLRRMQLPHGGFFQDDLTIKPFGPEEEYFTFVTSFLEDPAVQKSLGRNLLQDLQQLLSQVVGIYPTTNDANITHGDFDQANILVKQVNGTWKVSAILDWEFVFAGTYLLDIGMMLRYSHKLPVCFEENFIQGITDHGAPLPKDWKQQAKLMDLLCLLQLAHFSQPAGRDYMNRDVVRLITHTVKKWRSF